MSGHPSQKSAEIGLFRPFSVFFALFRRVRRAPGKSRKRRKKAFFLRYPRFLKPPSLKPPFAAPQVLQACHPKTFSALYCRLAVSETLCSMEGSITQLVALLALSRYLCCLHFYNSTTTQLYEGSHCVACIRNAGLLHVLKDTGPNFYTTPRAHP